MKAPKAIATIGSGLFTAAGLTVSIAQWAGYPFSGVIGAIVSYSFIWFPIAAFILGAIIGWSLCESATIKKANSDIKELTTRRDALLTENESLNVRVRSLEAEANELRAKLSQRSSNTEDPSAGKTSPDKVDWSRYSTFQLQFLLEFVKGTGPLEYRASDCGYIELEDEGIIRKDDSGMWGKSGATFWRINPDWRSAVRRDEKAICSLLDNIDESKKRQRVERVISSSIKHLGIDIKGIVYVIHREGQYDSDSIDGAKWYDPVHELHRKLSHLKEIGIVDYETLHDGRYRWILTDSAKSVIDSNPELLEEGRKYVEEIRCSSD